MRYPFKKWQWLTVEFLGRRGATRSTAQSQTARPDWSRSTADRPTSRQPAVLHLQRRSSGPVFMRIWDTPDNGYAEKFKHSIEPFAESAADVGHRRIRPARADRRHRQHRRRARSITYGAEQPVLREAQARAGSAGQAQRDRQRRPASVLLQRPGGRAVRHPVLELSSSAAAPPSNFSPVAAHRARGSPTNDVTASLSMDFDSHYHALRTISANGDVHLAAARADDVGWSKKSFIEGLAGLRRSELPRPLHQPVDQRPARGTTATAGRTRSTTTSCGRP